MKPECTDSSLSSLDDRVLLRRFVQDADESAFAEIVNRYQHLVMSVCGRILGAGADSEDAFQATFVSLARRPRSIRSSQALSSWLYTVAYRTSWRIIRHRKKVAGEVLENDSMSTSVDPLDEISDAQDCVVVDEELQRLPAKFKDVLVMTYFANQTSQQIADALHVSKGTIDGRIRDARNMLRVRLARRGVTVGAIGLAAVVSSETAAAVTPALLQSTVQLGAQALTNPAAMPSEFSSLQHLIRPETTIVTTKLFTTITMLGIAAIGAAGISGLMAAQQQGSGTGPAPVLNAVVDQTDDQQSEPEPITMSQQKTTPKRQKPNPQPRQVSDMGGMMGGGEMGMGGMMDAGGMGMEMGGMMGMGMGPAALPGGQNAGPKYSHIPGSASPIEKQIYEALEQPIPPMDFPGETSLQEILDTTFAAMKKEFPDVLLVPDVRELNLEGIDSLNDMLVKDIQLQKIDLKDALDIVFHQTVDPELSYVVENDVFLITTKTKADSTLVTRVYPAKELLALYPDPSNSPADFGEMGGYGGAMGDGGYGAGSGMMMEDPMGGSSPPRRQKADGGGLMSLPPQMGGLGGQLPPIRVPGHPLAELIQEMTSPPALWMNVAGEGGSISVAGNALVIRQSPSVHHEIVELMNMLLSVKQ